MTHFSKILVASVFALGMGNVAAYADACSGRSHDTGTAVGAVGGGLIGGLATHSVVGGLAGAVVGGVAGNAIARDQDCSRPVRHRYSYRDSRGRLHYAYR